MTDKTQVRTVDLTEAAMEALEARGIDVETAVRVGVRSVEKRRRGDDVSEWIAFPHISGGEVVHMAFRTITGDKKFYQLKGGRRSFWNAECLRDASLHHDSLLITEGHMDALAAMTVGRRAVVSVCDGAPKEAMDPDRDEPKRKYGYVLDELEQIQKFRDVIIAADGDDAGAALLSDLSNIIGAVRCRWVEYPLGCKDLNDVLRAHGEAGLVDLLHAAKPIPISGLYGYNDLPPLPRWPIARSGIEGLDGLWHFRPGELSVVVGYPNVGKTTWLNFLAVQISQTNGWCVCFLSPEQQPRHQKEELMKVRHGGPLTTAHHDERRAAETWVENRFVCMWPGPDDEATVPWVLERMEAAFIRYNARLLIIDPWNDLEHHRPDYMGLEEYEVTMLKRIRRTAQRLGVHVIIAAHPRKPSGKADQDGNYAPPTGYEISGSAHWVNKPDIGVTLHRVQDNIVQAWTWKVRYRGDTGQLGRANFAFSQYTSRFGFTAMADSRP